MKRESFLRTTGASALAASAATTLTPLSAAGDKKALLIAEPVHSLGYLPLYVAIDKGFFPSLSVSTITLPSSGSEHTDAVLTGKAWAFIGGPEHNAYADVKGAHLKAICNVVNRGNVYFVAAKGIRPTTNLHAFFKGKRIATSGYGGTPNSITRYLLKKNGLDPQSDVQLLEVATPAIPAVMIQGKADIGVMDEPMLTKGIVQGVWGEPFYSAPRVLGPYAYSTINVTQKTIDDDTATVRTFVAGMLKGLALVHAHRDAALEVAAKEYPDLSATILRGAIDRAYNDHIWEYSGKISPAAVRTAEEVVIAAGLLKSTVAYGEIVDPRFFNTVAKGA